LEPEPELHRVADLLYYNDAAPCGFGSATLVCYHVTMTGEAKNQCFGSENFFFRFGFGSTNFFSDTDSDTDSADIYFGTNHSFNGLRTFSEYNTTKKKFVTVKICASFHLTLLVFVMLYYQIIVSESESVSESEFCFGFGFGYGKKFRIHSDSDSDPQHCKKL
jgi:hypothetical protein